MVSGGNAQVLDQEEKEILLCKNQGQPLGVKLTAAEMPTGGSSTRHAIIIKNIALGSPAHTSGKLRYIIILFL